MTVATGVALGARVSTKPYIYFYMSILCAVTAFVGFMPTFWLPMTRGDYVASPVLAIHGLLFSTWVLFFVLQNGFAVSGRIANHRSAGLFGIALASVMTVFGYMAVINEVQRSAEVGALDIALSFSILPVWHITLFAILITLAITNISRPDWHKRLMLVATISLLDAPIARLFTYFVAFNGQMPVPAGLPVPPPPLGGITPWAYIVDLYLLIPIVYDWRTRGRPHIVYLVGAGTIVLLEALEGPIGRTAVWHGVANWLVSLAG